MRITSLSCARGTLTDAIDDVVGFTITVIVFRGRAVPGRGLYVADTSTPLLARAGLDARFAEPCRSVPARLRGPVDARASTILGAVAVFIGANDITGILTCRPYGS